MTPSGLILLIDDNVDDQLLLGRALRREGITNTVESVTSAVDAKCYLKGEGRFTDRNRFPFPCLVLLNISMARDNGLELLEWIRQQKETGRLPIVSLGNSERAVDIQKAFDLGANAYFAKQLHLADLVHLIKELEFVEEIITNGGTSSLKSG